MRADKDITSPAFSVQIRCTFAAHLEQVSEHSRGKDKELMSAGAATHIQD